MEYRNLKSTDYQEFSTLNREIQEIHYKAEPEIFKPSKEIITVHEYEKIMNDPKRKVRLAFLNNKVIGYYMYEILDKEENYYRYKTRELYIHHFGIGKEFQGKGLGEQMIQDIILFSKSENISLLTITVWTFNQIAKKFYQKNGFDVFHEKMRLKTN
ncbi:acetyltransferase, GNAT family [Bacteriovorax sp. BSW11_IV]|uniref:GNAT family N-acetyltransferase n=1 Tax=Bacteriovorax sp. BSW11_IV TaxID=1353529 RepID=UPI00038A1E6D|nr:GNAT family N-acetyltransferase [Bacteriovorax sp. BSW11_IV]EQC49236.1 acetyltransferase, GNAT family [Bacteriovorax sp. BSW11_IV]